MSTHVWRRACVNIHVLEKDIITNFINQIIVLSALRVIHSNNVQPIYASGRNNRLMKPVSLAVLIHVFMVPLQAA